MSVKNEIENISAAEAQEKLNDPNVQFIDVRDKESFSKGTIGNAIHLDRAFLEFYLADGSPLENKFFKEMAGGLPLIVPDTGGCAEVADRHASEFYTARDAQSAAAAIHRLFARDQRVLRRAVLVAAGKVRSDRDHAVELMDYYQGLVDAKRNGALLKVA